MKSTGLIGWCFLLSLTLVRGARAQLPGFGGLGFLDPAGASPRSEAYGVSADGKTIAGFSGLRNVESSYRAFRWTLSTGMVSLGALTATTPYSDAVAISGDGSTVVGESRYGDSMVAQRWTAATGMGAFGFPLGGTSSNALAVSSDGTFIAGYTDSGATRSAFRWSSSTGAQFLGTYVGGGNFYQPNGISGDGSVIVGSRSGGGGFVWNATNGMQSFNDFVPSAITSDGTWIVGGGARWSQGTGVQSLGGGFTRAMAVSSDGGVIVGDDMAGEAYIWDIVHGSRKLEDFLVGELGLDFTGWQLEFASGVSADGNTIVGKGINPDGNTEAWMATVPEPSQGAFVLVSTLMLLHRRRR